MTRTSARTVVFVGAGGLGCASLFSFARSANSQIADVHLRILDPDTVHPSNLNRQILFSPQDIGKPKAEIAAARLRTLRPELEIESRIARLQERNIAEHLADAALVVDGTDSSRAKLLINDFCVKNGVPFIYGGATGYDGMLLTILNGSPCVRCLFGDFEHEDHTFFEGSCREQGIVGAVTGIIGGLQSESIIRALNENLEPQFVTFALRDGNIVDRSSLLNSASTNTPCLHGRNNELPDDTR